MNFALDKFPEAVRIGGKAVPVNTDFRVALRIIKAFGDSRLLPHEKISVMLGALYPKIPENTAEAISQGFKFLNAGKETNGKNSLGARVYSFDKDAQFIYTAFRSTFNIDLNNVENLHWWAFKSMISDFSPDCFFNTLIQLRSRKNSGKLTKEEKDFVRRNPDLIYLDDNTGSAAVMDFISKIGRSGGNA